MKTNTLSLTLLVASLAVQAQAPAQTAAVVEQLATVTMSLLRDPASFPMPGSN